MTTDTRQDRTTPTSTIEPTDIAPNGISVSDLGIPEGHVLVLGLLPLKEGQLESVRTGHTDLVMQGVPFTEFLRTLKVMIGNGQEHTNGSNGEGFFQPEASAESDALKAASLTSRERQVMGLIGAGMSNKEIATRLNVGIHTVKTHVHNVLGKLAVRTRLEVAALLHAADTARAREQFSRVA